MTANELKRIFQKGECLSLETMKLYSDGKLSKKSAHLVEEHLLECGLCAGAMDGLNSKRIAEVTKLSSHIQRRLSVYMNTPPRVPFFRRYGFSLIAGLILLSGGTTVWYFATRNSPIQQHITDSTNAALQRQASLDINTSGRSDQPVVDNANGTNNIPLTSSTHDTHSGSSINLSDNVQNLPATQPGKNNTFTVDQNQSAATTTSTTTQSNNTSDGSNTRTAANNTPIKIKSVIAYPPVTHDNGKGGSSSGGNGQIGISQQSSASFQQDQMPTYPGGDEALKSYIMSNFKPQTLDRSAITRYTNGAIITVNSKTGEVTDVQLSYSISKAMDDELIRVLKAMPYWNPGKKRGAVDVMIGVTFE
ncbi:MAG TPA: hypothetical protein VL651_09350 [Bacteroidia bacterium]|jgi:hypothetical protein|nr:hypothetical protein [Bacteroidia bacterium]